MNMIRTFKKREIIAILLLILAAISIIYFNVRPKLDEYFDKSNKIAIWKPAYVSFDKLLTDIQCYKNNPMTQNEKQLNKAKNIFFIESSCHGGLNSKQACSVESTAKTNPGWNITVLFAGLLSGDFKKSTVYRRLSSMKNVELETINVESFTKDTPLEKLFSSEILAKSKHPVVHSSDVLRIVTLYKHSGLYLDLDVIVVKPFDSLPENFVVKEAKSSVANGILGFSDDAIGRNFSKITATDLASSYEPESWSGNGPALIERALNKICNTSKISNMSADTCNGFSVLEPKFFFPIYYPNWREYYSDAEPVIGEEYGHHMWNAMAYKEAVPKNSMYSRLARKFCPEVYEVFGEQFGS